MPPLPSGATGFDGSTTILPTSFLPNSGMKNFVVSNQSAGTTTSDFPRASPTSAEVARSPSSAASLSALLLSRFARTTRSPPRTRLRATIVPIVPTPMIAVVINPPLSDSAQGALLDPVDVKEPLRKQPLAVRFDERVVVAKRRDHELPFCAVDGEVVR